MKHFLKLSDLSAEEIYRLLDIAADLKYKQKNGIPHRYLEGKTIALVFKKASTRTRASFEVGAYQLGAYGAFLNAADMQISRGEPVQDTIRVLSRYFDMLMIRTFEQSYVEDLAKYGSIPIINGLTDYCHPTQVIADLMTIREYKGGLEGLKLCYIGDGNNMANSYIVGALKAGMRMTAVCPEGYRPDPFVLNFAKAYGDKFKLCGEPLEGVVGADVLCTDVWTSMGQEEETEKRKRAFDGYQINDEIMSAANPGAVVLHCLPAHRGEEITEKVFEEHADEIFDEAENRLHAHKAIMVALSGNCGK
ncbi:MAG: ornithine carbamoyltransferase [Clostridiales bacterium]|jgi:ornithine carbamoyltransferase|nr:ornithine carbamoyltransferase [Clostridiales bacterium]